MGDFSISFSTNGSLRLANIASSSGSLQDIGELPGKLFLRNGFAGNDRYDLTGGRNELLKAEE